jgi:hypothetical protein
VSDWSTNEWVRFVETILLVLVGGCYVWTLWSIGSGLLAGRAHTHRQQKYAIGRAFRASAILALFVGAIHALVTRFDDHISLRSVCWMIGCWLAFIAFLILDRGRWDGDE